MFTKHGAAKHETTNAIARDIIKAEKLKTDSKTAKLRAARLAKEQAELLQHKPGKVRAKARRTKGL